MVYIPNHRRIPLSTRMGVLFGGFKSQFGWAFFGFGLIFFWAFAMHADLSEIYFDENTVSTEGVAVRWQNTDASEGGVPVFQNYFRFTAKDGNEYEGISYATGIQVVNGEPLEIEYPQDKPQYARIKGMRRQMFSPFVLFVIIFPLVGLIFILYSLRRSSRAMRLLKYGELTKGVLISKERTNTKINGRTVYRMTFSYKDEQGGEYTVRESTPMPRILQDEKEERLIYLRSKPSNAIMLDALPGAAIVNNEGRVEPYPLRNVILLMLFPASTIIGHGIYLVNTYLG